jgi:class I fructose-bisphosphate aldolase
MHLGKAIRMERIINRNTKRAIIVPMDHGTTVGPLPVTCPPKPGPGIMLEFLTKEDGIWPGKDEHQNRL